MADYVDVDLQADEFGLFDIVIGADGDFAKTLGFDTNIKVALFSEARAQPAEVPEASRRRGWWGNTTNDDQSFQLGSKFWLLEQARLTPLTQNVAVNYAREALSWMVTDGYAQDVQTSVALTEGKMVLSMSVIRDQAKATSQYYTVWQNTGTGNLMQNGN